MPGPDCESPPDPPLRRADAPGVRPSAADRQRQEREQRKARRREIRDRNKAAYDRRGGNDVNQLGCGRCEFRGSGCDLCKRRVAVRAARERGSAAVTTLAAVSREAAEKAIRAKVRPTGTVGGIEPAPPVPKRKPAEPAAAYLRRLERLAADANKAADVPGLQGLLVRILEAYRVYADQEPERSARIVAPHHTARMYELRPDWVPWTSGTLPPLHDQRRWAFNAYMLELTGRGRSSRTLSLSQKLGQWDEGRFHRGNCRSLRAGIILPRPLESSRNGGPFAVHLRLADGRRR